MANSERPITVLATDYDGTIALTSETPPGGVDVDHAYAKAISEVLDDDKVGQQFLNEGGHRHRNPIEIAQALRPDFDRDSLIAFAREITVAKLDILLDQIGTPLPDGQRWPRPTHGFPELWNEVTGGYSRIGTAIFSAGHTEFISAWFEEFGLRQPDCMVTDDVVSGLALRMPVEKIVKPSPFLMKIAEPALRLAHEAPVGRTVYAGDDPNKDAGFAQNIGAEFVLIEADRSGENWNQVRVLLGLGAVSIGEPLNG